MFGTCVAMTATWNENYLDQVLKNTHTKKIQCSKFNEKNMGHAHIPRNLAQTKGQNSQSVLKWVIQCTGKTDVCMQRWKCWNNWISSWHTHSPHLPSFSPTWLAGIYLKKSCMLRVAKLQPHNTPSRKKQNHFKSKWMITFPISGNQNPHLGCMESLGTENQRQSMVASGSKSSPRCPSPLLYLSTVNTLINSSIYSAVWLLRDHSAICCCQ